MHSRTVTILLTSLVFLNFFRLVLSFPQDPTAKRAEPVCDPEDCNGSVEDNDGGPSYTCPDSSKRLFVRRTVSMLPHYSPEEKLIQISISSIAPHPAWSWASVVVGYTKLR